MTPKMKGSNRSAACTVPTRRTGGVQGAVVLPKPMCEQQGADGAYRLRDLLGEVDSAGWDGPAGAQVFGLIRYFCQPAAARWARRVGDLGDVGVSAGWMALTDWLTGDRHADPVGVLRTTLGRVYAAEAGAVELCAGDPVRRPREIVRMIREQSAPRRADVDLALRPIEQVDEPAGPAERPAWLRVTAALLVLAGWAWPQPPGECLAAMVIETAQHGRRSASALARHATGVPPGTWSALALLAAGSGPGCAPDRAWPGIPAIHAIGGGAAVRDSLEVHRIVRAAVAGRPVRSGRAWLAGCQAAS